MTTNAPYPGQLAQGIRQYLALLQGTPDDQGLRRQTSQFRLATCLLFAATFLIGVGSALLLVYVVRAVRSAPTAALKEEAHTVELSRDLAAAKLARHKADLLVAEATSMKSQSTAVLEERVHELFPKIRKVLPGRNDVSDGYVDWFEIIGDRIRVRIINGSMRTVEPDFAIVFVNRLGFVTAEYSDRWIIDKLDPDEAHVGDGPLWIRAGQPTYYLVKR